VSGLVAPFPYFGGKRWIASEVWAALGDVACYVEPFFGSGAVLLGRPGGAGHTETVNDIDGMISNFWRAIAADPAAVACHADWPVNECDLHARHVWLVNRRADITSRLMGDPDWFDAKAAGWWCWGACAWIGSGWCSGDGPWLAVDGLLVRGTAGRGINRKLPHLGDAGRGINRKLPHLGNAGRGINRQLPHLGDAGRGDRSAFILEWMTALSTRLRNVRVACGDWTRVCGDSVTYRHGLTGVFLDPPYHAAGVDTSVYTEYDHGIADAVIAWAIEAGARPDMRVALCGYDGFAMPDDWRAHRWKARGGFGSQGNGTGRENASREVIWFSPHCLGAERSAPLFAHAGLELGL
jgi:hypothetical protein